MTVATLSAIRRLRPDVPVIVRAQYLRELDDLTLDANTEIVVAEFETSIEMLARTLRSYGTSDSQISGFVAGLRKKLESRTQSLWSTGDRMTLPSWEAISRIRPLRLDEKAPGVGQSLSDLRLRELTGTNLVCVFRAGLGTTVPTADFVIQPGDILHLIGSPESLSSAEELLLGSSHRTGKPG